MQLVSFLLASMILSGLASSSFPFLSNTPTLNMANLLFTQEQPNALPDMNQRRHPTLVQNPNELPFLRHEVISTKDMARLIFSIQYRMILRQTFISTFPLKCVFPKPHESFHRNIHCHLAHPLALFMNQVIQLKQDLLFMKQYPSTTVNLYAYIWEKGQLTWKEVDLDSVISNNEVNRTPQQHSWMGIENNIESFEMYVQWTLPEHHFNQKKEHYSMSFPTGIKLKIHNFKFDENAKQPVYFLPVENQVKYTPWSSLQDRTHKSMLSKLN